MKLLAKTAVRYPKKRRRRTDGLNGRHKKEKMARILSYRSWIKKRRKRGARSRLGYLFLIRVLSKGKGRGDITGEESPGR